MKIVITLPDYVTEDIASVQEAMDAMIQLAGGFTAVPCKGAWKSPTCGMIEEEVTQYHFCFGPHVGYSTATGAAKDVVKAVLSSTTEEAVLVERHDTRGYVCNIYTREDLQ